MFASNINGGKGGGGGENHTETHKHGLSLSLLFLPHHAHAGTHRTANELTECTFTQTNESSPLSVTQHYLPKSLTMELFVEGDEGSYLPNCQTYLVIAVYALVLIVF